jgi:hypothetical protein
MGAATQRPAPGRAARRILCLAAAALAAAQAGCLFVAAGVAGGAAATGYYYYKGRYYREYPAGLADAMAAVRTALGELQFPLISEEVKNATAYVESKAADGSHIRIYLDSVSSPVPADGTLTRVAVRVGAFGDEDISRRILDQVSAHLVQPGLLRPVPAPHAAAAPPPAGAVQPVSAQMPGEPPLAPPAPVVPKGK